MSKLVGKDIIEVQKSVNKTPNGRQQAEFFEFLSNDGTSANSSAIILAPFAKWAGFLSMEQPCYYASEIGQALAPKFSRWNLQPPSDIQVALNAPACHRVGITGRNIKVAMIDSGIARHPFFDKQAYNISWPRPDDARDEKGHGTGEVANLFAVAPDVTVISVRRDIAQPVESFRRAMATQPDIINCSWAFALNKIVFDSHRSLDLLIRKAVDSGIIVVCAAGNGLNGFPAQHPDVIAAGACYLSEKSVASMADYSSAFDSQVYEGRRVPDLCGVAGQSLESPYLHLPVPAGSEYDLAYSSFQESAIGGDSQNRDQDGWAAFSGTSAAAPQIAGVCALMLQAQPDLHPHEIRHILMSKASAVLSPESGAPDTRAGSGLVDAWAAVSSVLSG